MFPPTGIGSTFDPSISSGMPSMSSMISGNQQMTAAGAQANHELTIQNEQLAAAQTLDQTWAQLVTGMLTAIRTMSEEMAKILKSGAEACKNLV